MKKIIEAIGIFLGICILVPLIIIVMMSLLGLGALVATVPEIMGAVLIICLVFAIPGIITGIVISHKK